MKDKSLRQNRAASFAVVLLVYILATAAGIGVFALFGGYTVPVRLALADVIATLVVWAGSLLLGNSSVYDPYWSVAPPVLLLLWALWETAAIGPLMILILACVFLWAARLTYNWAVNFENLTAQDWRYTMLREKAPSLWFVTNLFGIQMMPTIIVYLCMVPVILTPVGSGLSPLSFVGAWLCVLAVLLQVVSDAQMLRFRRESTNRGSVNRTGLWKYSRHPNYLGEILFWWGVWVMAISSGAPMPYAIIGPIAVTLLFVFISIPMMEKRQLERRAEYAEYRKETSMLLLWPPRHVEAMPEAQTEPEAKSHTTL